MKPIKRIAAELGIAEIRIWVLIRKGKIRSRADLYAVYVDRDEVTTFAQRHPRLLERCRQALQTTQTHYARM